MNKTAIIGIALLGLLWGWLAWGVLSAGITLYSLLVTAVSGMLTVVPVWRKYHKPKDK